MSGTTAAADDDSWWSLACRSLPSGHRRSPQPCGTASPDEENTMSHSPALPLRARIRSNKVPDPTASFWIIKVLATTVGETAADLLSDTVGLGLPLTTLVMAVALAVFLFLQFRSRSYGRRCTGSPSCSSASSGPASRTTSQTASVSRSRSAPPSSVSRSGGLHDLVPGRGHPLDPRHRHRAAGGVLLARDPVHVRARHGSR